LTEPGREVEPYIDALVNGIGAFLLAVLVASTVGVIQNDAALNGWHFTRGHGWLSLLGVGVLCYWMVCLGRMCWESSRDN
jgi:formate/nitrite transporter FocA (FNT family)